MTIFLNLIELLKSQLSLYTELKSVLNEEKDAITSWKFKDTNKLVKEKENLIRKEHIYEEARKTLVMKIAEEYGINNISIKSIANVSPSEDIKLKIESLAEELYALAMEVRIENTALKMLYSTNIRLINEFNAKIGYIPVSNKYGMERNLSAGLPVSISAIG